MLFHCHNSFYEGLSESLQVSGKISIESRLLAGSELDRLTLVGISALVGISVVRNVSSVICNGKGYLL